MAIVVVAGSAWPLVALILVGAIVYGTLLTVLGGLPIDDLRALRGVST